MNGQVQYRGLPAPPLEALVFDDGMPPPCPREMYSQSGVYDVIPGDPHQKRHKKPATPQRSPSTRLSTQSTSSHDEVFMDHSHSPRQQTTSQSPRQSSHHSPHSNIAHQQQILRQQPNSPKMQQKHMSQPDPTQSKPFSYFGNAPVSPRHRHSEGQVHYPGDISPNDSNYEQVNQMNYYQNGRNGVHRSTGYEYPSNLGENQTGGLVYVPGSPISQRQSSLTRKESLSPLMNRRKDSPQNLRMQGQRCPPSFPAPIAPHQIRAASPPLPPPPGAYDQPPPPPPIEKIPGHQSVSSFEIGKKRRQSAETDINRNQVQDDRYYPRQSSVDSYNPLMQQQQSHLVHQQDSYFATQQQPYGAGVPWQQQQQQQYAQQVPPNVPYTAPQPVTGGLSEQINKVKLKTAKSSSTDGISNEEKKANELAAELNKVKLKAVKGKEVMSSTPEKSQETAAVILPKLKPTGAKPWEKDVSDTSPEHHSRQDNFEDQYDDDYFPPPPPDIAELPPMESEPVHGIQTTPTSTKPQIKKGSVEPGLSKMADFEIDLNSIDYSQIPGYVPITAAVPNWKRDMIEKKNQEKVEQYILQLKRQKEEEEKWKNVPEWKRKILMEKAALKAETDEQIAYDEARKQKEKKERKFDSPDQVKLKPVKPKSESEIPENMAEPTLPQQKEPLQEVQQNIPTKQPEVTSKNIQTKNINPTDNLPPPPPPAVVEKPKKTISIPDPELLPPPPPDLEDDDDKLEEMRRKEEKRRQIEAEANEDESGELPAWKKEIMMKRGGVPKNWGDEREEINEAE